MKIIEKAMEDDIILFARLHGADAAIERIERETEEICQKYLSGELCLEDAAKEAFAPWNAHSIMHANRWSLWPTYPRGTDYARSDRYEAMAKDYELWKRGEPLSGEKWLFTWESDSILGLAPYRMADCQEATDYEKVQFFSACEAAITPISIFDSPSGMLVPSFWNANSKGKLNIELKTDAAPLLLADDPIAGKEFCLPIENGGTLCIKVIDVDSEASFPLIDEKDDDSLESLEWECEGYIVGYTSTTPRKITFSTWDNEISLVTADVLEDEDWAAYKACELWKPFEEWIARHNAQIDAEAKDMFEKAGERIALFGGGGIEDTEEAF